MLTDREIVSRNETLGWHFVGVDAHMDATGKVEPRAIYWDDGRRFEIDQVIRARRAYRELPERWWYLVRIGDQYRELWWDNPSWHVLVSAGQGGAKPHTDPDTTKLYRPESPRSKR